MTAPCSRDRPTLVAPVWEVDDVMTKWFRLHRHTRSEHTFYAFGVRESRCRCGYTWPPEWPDT